LRRRPSLVLAWIVLAALVGAGCASRSGPPPGAEPPDLEAEARGLEATPPAADLEYDPLFDEPVEPAVEDPLENSNRAVFAGNRNIDRFLIDPIARAYAFVVPDFARRAIRRVFVNLNSPSVFVNHLLQLSPGGAGTTGARFLINTTVGLVGLWDAAARIGLDERPTDFGITLAKYGVDSGPYLVLPLVGPTTARDAFGDLVDILMLPQTWFLGPTTWVFVAYQGGDGFTLRDVHRDALEALEESSVDFYVAMRFAYLTNREAEIEAVLGPHWDWERDDGAAAPDAVPAAEAAGAGAGP
jgi:phospholipid-binding lipoprotein MlaA